MSALTLEPGRAWQSPEAEAETVESGYDQVQPTWHDWRPCVTAPCPFCHPALERVLFEDGLVRVLADGFPVSPGPPQGPWWQTGSSYKRCRYDRGNNCPSAQSCSKRDRISAGDAFKSTVANRIWCPWITTLSSTASPIAGCSSTPLAQSASLSPRPTCDRR